MGTPVNWNTQKTRNTWLTAGQLSDQFKGLVGGKDKDFQHEYLPQRSLLVRSQRREVALSHGEGVLFQPRDRLLRKKEGGGGVHQTGCPKQRKRHECKDCPAGNFCRPGGRIGGKSAEKTTRQVPTPCGEGSTRRSLVTRRSKPQVENHVKRSTGRKKMAPKLSSGRQRPQKTGVSTACDASR